MESNKNVLLILLVLSILLQVCISIGKENLNNIKCEISDVKVVFDNLSMYVYYTTSTEQSYNFSINPIINVTKPIRTKKEFLILNSSRYTIQDSHILIPRMIKYVRYTITLEINCIPPTSKNLRTIQKIVNSKVITFDVEGARGHTKPGKINLLNKGIFAYEVSRDEIKPNQDFCQIYVGHISKETTNKDPILNPFISKQLQSGTTWISVATYTRRKCDDFYSKIFYEESIKDLFKARNTLFNIFVIKYVTCNGPICSTSFSSDKIILQGSMYKTTLIIKISCLVSALLICFLGIMKFFVYFTSFFYLREHCETLAIYPVRRVRPLIDRETYLPYRNFKFEDRSILYYPGEFYGMDDELNFEAYNSYREKYFEYKNKKELNTYLDHVHPKRNKNTVKFADFENFLYEITMSPDGLEYFYQLYNIHNHKFKDDNYAYTKNERNRNMDVVTSRKALVGLQITPFHLSNYVNSAHCPGLNSNTELMLTQVPLEEHITDFYRTIIDHKVATVVSLGFPNNNFFRLKTTDIVPHNSGSENYDNIHVEYEIIWEDKFIRCLRYYITRKNHPVFNVKEYAYCTQFYLKNWNLVKNSENFIQFARLRYEVRRSHGNLKNPMMLQCNDGGNASSLFATYHMNMLRYEHNWSDINIVRYLVELRKCRRFALYKREYHELVYKMIHSTLICQSETMFKR